ncbi:putative kinase [Methylomonas methanica]|uniref:Kinase n=2 Tax=Methylomonas methanica TaxID=421 RepID=A0ABY2CFH6_METMH|nr:putative kinase [Methylomonas methanica]
MSKSMSTLHLLCGKIASGKSTLANELAKAADTVLICEDVWLAHLYPDNIKSIADYVRYASNLRGAIKPHVIDLLLMGVSVVLDFPANTEESRKWMRSIIDEAGSKHTLHFLDVSDDDCLTRLHTRNESGAHAFVVADTEFELITNYFVAPQQEENFDVIRYQVL